MVTFLSPSRKLVHQEVIKKKKKKLEWHRHHATICWYSSLLPDLFCYLRAASLSHNSLLLEEVVLMAVKGL